MSAVSFFEAMTAAMVLRGNCYAKIVRAQNKSISRLELQLPDNVNPPVLTGEDTVTYTILDPHEVVDGEDMLHIAGLGGDGINGWSVVKYGSQSIGTGIAGDGYSASQMGNGAKPSGVLKFPTRLDENARRKFRTEWNEEHQGSQNAGNIAILHGGMEFLPISMTNEDAQFLESRQFSVREIARWFRLPPHMLADLQDSSVRANIEQQAMEFITYSMAPWLTRWQQALNRKLLTQQERDEGMYFEFLLDALLRGDATARFAAYAQGRQWGWMSVNDIRRRENMNLVDGGDVYLQPSNMIPADSDMAKGDRPDLPPQPAFGQPRQPPPAAPPIEPPDDSAASAFDSACNDLLRSHIECLQRVERAEVMKAAKSVAYGKNYVERLTAWYAEFEQLVASKIGSVVDCYGKISKPRAGLAVEMAAGYCRDHHEELMAAADGESKQFAKRVQSVLDGWGPDCLVLVDWHSQEELEHVA
jgi:HK97 family phage portal protein